MMVLDKLYPQRSAVANTDGVWKNLLESAIRRSVLGHLLVKPRDDLLIGRTPVEEEG